MDDVENKGSESASKADAAKEAALRMKEEATQALGDIKGRGLAGFFSFDRMYFPIIARYLFIVMVVLAGLGIVLSVVLGFIGIFTSGFFTGITVMVAFPIMGILGIIFLRLWFEMILLGFNINENLQTIRERGCK